MIEGKEVILRGLSVSQGIGIGTPIFFVPWEEDVPEVQIPQKDVPQEINRYREALHQSRQDVERLREMSLHEGPPEIVAILGTHLEMMQDPMMTTIIEEKIRAMQCNTESVFSQLIEEYKKRFETIQDIYFQERVRDVIDVSRRILSYLRPVQRMKLSEIPPNSIVLTHELVPSETVEAQASLVSAFVTAVGGLTSHSAIIARAKGIPYVANIDIKIFKRIDLQSLIVDGAQGIVIINPNRSTLKKYQTIKKNQLESYRQLEGTAHLKGETIDRYEVRIFANLENPKDVDGLLKSGAVGVGLFRSEYLFLAKRQFPDEEEQFEIYKTMLQELQGKPLVIRIFDIGGDKKIDLLPEEKDSHYFAQIGLELNPALGCRAIRFLLRFPELLKTQLRAILRASAFGPVQILIPMISDLAELQQIRTWVQALSKELPEAVAEVPIGCMIEVPSSAIMCDALAESADFLSIGTNDLIQYTLAADRNNPHTSELYFSTHPSMLRLIQAVASAATHAKKPIILCGECATDPMMIPLLLGLGIREFSIASRHIPLVKHTIRKWRIIEACRLAQKALEFTGSRELKAYLQAETAR